MANNVQSILQACLVISVLNLCLYDKALPAAEDENVSATARAGQILQLSGVRGGMVVHLGCGDGRLTRALYASGNFTVHGLDSDVGKVAVARQDLTKHGRYGAVSVERWTGSTLPYGDDLVNLVVDEDGTFPEREILRVLAPGGVACSFHDGRLTKTVKPRPDDIDEWSHYLHDAGNNPVADDERVGPPRSLRWIAPPLWLRSHETPSGIEGMISAGGRLFYFFDEGVIGITDQRLPERWSLVCRDAFNGRELWKQPLAAWGWPEWAPDKFGEANWTDIRGGRTVVPIENQRRLVADSERLYATLAYNAPLSILDARTGEMLATVDETAPVREIMAEGGIVVTHSRREPTDLERRRGVKNDAPSILTAVRGSTGEVLWRHESKPIKDLFVAIDDGRVIFQTGTALTALSLADGKPLWQAKANAGGHTLIAHSGVVLVYSKAALEAFDAADGKPMWSHEVPGSPGAESDDLFVADGLVWRGMVPVTGDDLKPAKKSTDAMSLAYDLRTGEEKKRIVVRDFRSPEHHHRCYRNKATVNYLISSMEGAEFMDLVGDNHGQNNFVRGACKLGMMPCNGMLYVPADQCFCQPGAKLLGFAALGAETPLTPVDDDRRLERGPAYDSLAAAGHSATSPDDWPTFRHDAARHGATSAKVPADVRPRWRVDLGGRLTAPVAVGDRVYVAARDAHTIHALEADTGKTVWTFVAGGRIDSPPTVHDGMVLFGSADGRVYCMRASDGELAWRFLAAPVDRRIGYFDQFESAWPVHGSILVHGGVAYATAGRSTYLDGGIRVYGLDPRTGEVLYRTTLRGPHRTVGVDRDLAFFIEGANSDVLVSEGDYLYMRQKKLTPQLEQIDIPILSSKGAQDVGLHVFSTSGLLDDSWYNRTFWMYARRWPGFQLANQAPKSGQLLVVDDEETFAVKVFTRRNVHSPMFFPGKEGYLVFADKNTNEPQIVGEPGSRKAVEWLPQSFIPRNGNPGLDSNAFGTDKMIGYTRAEPPRWARWVKIRARAMVKADKILFLAGAPDVLDKRDPYAALEGREGALLAAVSAEDGSPLAQVQLAQPPVFDGLIAAAGRLYASLEDGSLVCLSAAE
jgi:outer membrane protein assembly factor BamB